MTREQIKRVWNAFEPATRWTDTPGLLFCRLLALFSCSIGAHAEPEYPPGAPRVCEWCGKELT